jgi:hypothetical protein
MCGINDPGHTCDEYLVLLVKSGMTGVHVHTTNSAMRIAAKFKTLRRVLKSKRWSKGITKSNFRNILKEHIINLLKFENEYWRQMYTVRWVQFGDEPTKFFHVATTERYRRNMITSMKRRQ